MVLPTRYYGQPTIELEIKYRNGWHIQVLKDIAPEIDPPLTAFEVFITTENGGDDDGALYLECDRQRITPDTVCSRALMDLLFPRLDARERRTTDIDPFAQWAKGQPWRAPDRS